MPGGLLNLVTCGPQSIILNGNPKKTFFKATYSKYTNFGLQKFRIDFKGLRTLKLKEESKFTFKIPRYAEMLMDAYFCIDLPTIWSPIYPPQDVNDVWRPYEFKWMEHIGTEMIKEVVIFVGGHVIQKYSGSYIQHLVDRDYPASKKHVFDKMTGHVSECHDPANSGGRIHTYPSAYYSGNQNGENPSIRGRKLCIPLNAWFQHNTKMAVPLIALQYAEIQVEITLRPIVELFIVRDVLDAENNYPYTQPDPNNGVTQMFRFLQSPPSTALDVNDYTDKRILWNAEPHLICTYGFLSDDEARVFASNEHRYLIKEVREYFFPKIHGAKKLQIYTSGLVSSWMFHFRRSDVKFRNQWTNYTNWAYEYKPYGLLDAPIASSYQYNDYGVQESSTSTPLELSQPNGFGPGVNPNCESTPWMITGPYSFENEKNILLDFAILLDGNYRENKQNSSVYESIEQIRTSNGSGKDGVFYYNFTMDTAPSQFQPSGALCMDSFKKIELEFTTIMPPLDESAETLAICDSNGVQIGVNKSTWEIYQYSYDMMLFEERYNILHFIGGNCGLMYAR